jgi:ubiquinone/menaquinone biosynthesis C-methylase UbiE
MAKSSIARVPTAEPLERSSSSAPASIEAQALAGKAVLLEIGARLGALDPLLSQRAVSIAEAAAASGVDAEFLGAFYCALTHAGLAQAGGRDANGAVAYSASPDMEKAINETGYVLWSVMSCAPLIENAESFMRDLPASIRKYPRHGDHVARTSKWMGERDFYPQAERAILSSNPKKLVDLGSGTCGLLIRCLRQLPEAKAVGIDRNAAACAKARVAVDNAGMAGRINVVEASIQSLVQNPSPIEGAEVIHAGFVFHELLPDEEATLDALLRTFREKAPRAKVVIVDAVPYGAVGGEEAFSAAYTFLHTHFMAQRLLTEEEWKGKLAAAGYRTIDVARLAISGGRIFAASPGGS